MKCLTLIACLLLWGAEMPQTFTVSQDRLVGLAENYLVQRWLAENPGNMGANPIPPDMRERARQLVASGQITARDLAPLVGGTANPDGSLTYTSTANEDYDFGDTLLTAAMMAVGGASNWAPNSTGSVFSELGKQLGWGGEAAPATTGTPAKTAPWGVNQRTGLESPWGPGAPNPAIDNLTDLAMDPNLGGGAVNLGSGVDPYGLGWTPPTPTGSAGWDAVFSNGATLAAGGPWAAGGLASTLVSAGASAASAAAAAKAVEGGMTLKDAMGYAGIAAPIAGAILGAGAVGSAADAQIESARLANDTLNKQFETTREDFRPWREAGVNALNQLTAGTAPGGEFTKTYTAPEFNFEADPGYQFRLSEGEKAIERAAAARGMRNSGAQYKDLLRFGQNTASAEYGNAFNRYDTNRKFDYNAFTTDQTNKYNRLAGIAGTGQNAMNTVAGAGQTNANAIANNQTNAGNVNAGATIAGVNALNSGISGALKSYNDSAMLDYYKGRDAQIAEAIRGRSGTVGY